MVTHGERGAPPTHLEDEEDGGARRAHQLRQHGLQLVEQLDAGLLRAEPAPADEVDGGRVPSDAGQALIAARVHDETVPEEHHPLLAEQPQSLHLQPAEEARREEVRGVVADEPAANVAREEGVGPPELGVERRGDEAGELEEGGVAAAATAATAAAAASGRPVAEVKVLQELEDDGKVAPVGGVGELGEEDTLGDPVGADGREAGRGKVGGGEGLAEDVPAEPDGIDKDVVGQSSLVVVDNLRRWCAHNGEEGGGEGEEILLKFDI